ncbi:acyl-CoA thioesterase [Pseudoprimorskyibacter insulae]|uniref:Thioeseterase n=1 Tax=Pseudoprimorskyibacter insulae TaxID=1695997 RepID=A0A2R8AUT9_9RHOB|nr:acyl-CoA thioesterase [Pseudoprimorskyibacter insulae]SPF79654.1 hypothetical protein PRI8871_01451 [Pseudoprimorskyibacter insulae]
MYPFIRMFYAMAGSRKLPPLALTDIHSSDHICMPWDLDLWNELNNGRTLTIYDLNRIPLAVRTGLIGVLRQEKWGLTMAGVMVRYRRRIRAFDRVTIKGRAVCFDDKFMYLEQSMWRRDGECANHAVYRAAVTSAQGIVPPAKVVEALGMADLNPDMPVWLQKWCETEALRPWPPMQD